MRRVLALYSQPIRFDENFQVEDFPPQVAFLGAELKDRGLRTKMELTVIFVARRAESTDGYCSRDIYLQFRSVFSRSVIFFCAIVKNRSGRTNAG